MTPYIPARPTTYNGIQMRSRLEATFAQHLDRKGLSWVYEPRAYAGPKGQYLPDFEVALTLGPVLIEVKPTVALALKALERIQIVWESVAYPLCVTVPNGPSWMAEAETWKWFVIDLPWGYGQ